MERTQQSSLHATEAVRIDDGGWSRAWVCARPFHLDEDIMEILRADKKLWKNFCSFPELYRRVRIDTIQIKRRQPELFRQRLNKFIQCTRQGKMYGAWNDGGKLSDWDVSP